MTFTFSRLAIYEKKIVGEELQQIKQRVMNRPNVIFSDGEGLGKDAVMISLHKSTKYVEFMKEYSSVSANFATDMQSFIWPMTPRI